MGRGNRLNINIDEVRTFNPRLANYIVKNPIQAIRHFEGTLNDSVKEIKDNSGKGGSEKT